MFTISDLQALVPCMHEAQLLRYVKMNKSMSMYAVAIASRHSRSSGHSIQVKTFTTFRTQHTGHNMLTMAAAASHTAPQLHCTEPAAASGLASE